MNTSSGFLESPGTKHPDVYHRAAMGKERKYSVRDHQFFFFFFRGSVFSIFVAVSCIKGSATSGVFHQDKISKTEFAGNLRTAVEIMTGLNSPEHSVCLLLSPHAGFFAVACFVFTKTLNSEWGTCTYYSIKVADFTLRGVKHPGWDHSCEGISCVFTAGTVSRLDFGIRL